MPPIMSILKIGSAQFLNREDTAFVSHGSPQVPGFLGNWGGHLHLVPSKEEQTSHMSMTGDSFVT